MKRLASSIVIGASVVLVAACAPTAQQESTGEYIDSSIITAKVKAALVEDPQLSALDISVETFKDTVALSGFVNSARQKARASAVVAKIDGVRRIENNLVVK